MQKRQTDRETTCAIKTAPTYNGKFPDATGTGKFRISVASTELPFRKLKKSTICIFRDDPLTNADRKNGRGLQMPDA